jgi:hypothetical protein
MTAAVAEEQTEDVLPGSPNFESTAYSPAFDFSGVQAQLGGRPTEVLVLGTTHLGGLPEDVFDPADLSLVLDDLLTFAPDVIAIESICGRGCDELRRYADLVPNAAENYCIDPDLALESLGMNQVEATVAVSSTFSDWADAPSAEDRRRFAGLLFGAGEPWSAALQWSRLDPNERIAADGISQALADQLDRLLLSRNENNLLGVTLARRLGLELLAATDDHSADIVQARAPDELDDAIMTVWQTEHPQQEEFLQLMESFYGSPEAVRDGYLALNSERSQRFAIERDFGLAAATSDMGGVTRQYVAWWQVRNLRMAANVIEAVGNRPGARVLVIVGASHKPYLEAYLDQMHDIELVSVEQVLSD